MGTSWTGIDFKGPIPKLERGDAVQLSVRPPTPSDVGSFFSRATVVASDRGRLTVEYCSGFAEKKGQLIPKLRYADIKWINVKTFKRFVA